MQEEENIKEEVVATVEPLDAEAARKAHNAAKARARYARMRALGLNSRGKPMVGQGRKQRDAAKQRRYQANYSRKEKAARKRLGLTIAEFKKLPTATRLMELNYSADANPVDKAERERARQRAWYYRNKAKSAQAAPPQQASNGVLSLPDRTIRFCPCCGWNIDASRKAQAFIDGRVSS